MSKSPVQINIVTPPPPSKEEIYDWLMDTYGLRLADPVDDPAPVEVTEKARAWASYLEGLQWGYIKPVVQIAVNAHHKHPAIVLSAAAGRSDDILFKLTARNHIDAKGSA